MIRRHIITGEPVICAPDRGGRPHAFIQTHVQANGAAASDPAEECPFCPGHEGMTPPELYRTGDAGGWRVRVFPNKYPAVEEHEVIVEAPEHGARFEGLAHAAEVVETFVLRHRQLAAHPGVRHVALFRNQGTAAGASLSHIHSQIAGLPFVPPRIAVEASAFARAGACPLCAAIEEHRRKELVIAENGSFVSIAPWASTFAHQQWIIPRRHCSDMGRFDDTDIVDLAALLQRASAAMHRLSPAQNWLFIGFGGQTAAHTYIELFPRVTNVAGFELATGTLIDVVDPAASARLLLGEAGQR